MVKEVAEFEITEFLLLVIAMLTSMVMLVFMALTMGIGLCVDLRVDSCHGDFDDSVFVWRFIVPVNLIPN